MDDRLKKIEQIPYFQKPKSLFEEFPALSNIGNENESLKTVITVIDRMNQTVQLQRDSQMNVLSRLDSIEGQIKSLQNDESRQQPPSTLTHKPAQVAQRRSTLAEAKQRSPVITSPRYNKRVLSPIPPDQQKEGSALRSVKKKNTLPIKAKEIVTLKPKRTKKSPPKEQKAGKMLEDPI